MGKRAALFLAFLSLAFWAAIPPPADAQRPPRRVAVLEFQNIAGDREFSWLSVAVPETLTTKLSALRALSLIERSQLEKIIKEQRFQLSDLADPKKAAKLGRLAGAQVVVLGSFTRHLKLVLFNVRFVDVETAGILGAADARGATDDAAKLFDSFNRLADAAIEALNTRVVVVSGEKQVAKAPEAERLSPTPREREKLRAPPAASLTAYQLYGKGREAYSRHRWEEAIGYYRQAVEKDPNYADALNGLGVSLRNQGRYEAALENYSRALALFRQKGNEKDEAAVLNNIGNIHQRRGAYDLALSFYEKSLEITRRLGDEPVMAKTYTNIGNVHQRRGAYDLALSFYEKSLEIERRLGDEPGMAKTYNNIGNVHQSRGAYDRALSFYEKSLEITRRLGDEPSMALTYNNIGAIHQSRGAYDRALSFYEKSLEIARRLGDEPGMARTHNNIGNIHQRRGAYDLALSFYEKSLEITRRLGDEPSMALTYNNIGAIHQSRGAYDLALSFYEKSLEITRRLGDREGTAITLFNMGLLAERRGNLRGAIAYMEEARDIYRSLGAPGVNDAERALERLRRAAGR